MKTIFSIAMLALTTLTYAQIEVSEYTRALKVDAYNVPEPDVEFTSPCGKVTVEITEKMASGGCLGNLIRTYNATDECGNTVFAEQYLSLQDKKGPEFIGVPEDKTVSSESEIESAPVVAAMDLGDEAVEVTLSVTKEENRIIRTWSATDKCGNESSESQVITILELNSKG